ncbi:uncharacterized protein [Dendropsophus ebraccatus]|uniref:uncharacterized protein n=1 Tax=Dendropsophus ebraccatus TaxID=150705 RepID=UPI003831D13D
MVRAVETRWSSVRDQYQRAIRTEERGGEPISMRYAPLLDFIPSRSQRQTSGNFADPPGGQDAAGSDVAASQQEGDSATPPPSQEPGSPTLSEGTEPMPGPSGSTSMHEEEEAAAPSTSGAGPSGVPLAARPRQPLTRPTTTTTRRRREQEEAHSALSELDQSVVNFVRRFDGGDDQNDFFCYYLGVRLRNLPTNLARSARMVTEVLLSCHEQIDPDTFPDPCYVGVLLQSVYGLHSRRPHIPPEGFLFPETTAPPPVPPPLSPLVPPALSPEPPGAMPPPSEGTRAVPRRQPRRGRRSRTSRYPRRL